MSHISLLVPSGYLTVCHGKSPFLIGKPSINESFPINMLNNQRVHTGTIWISEELCVFSVKETKLEMFFFYKYRMIYHLHSMCIQYISNIPSFPLIIPHSSHCNHPFLPHNMLHCHNRNRFLVMAMLRVHHPQSLPWASAWDSYIYIYIFNWMIWMADHSVFFGGKSCSLAINPGMNDQIWVAGQDQTQQRSGIVQNRLRQSKRTPSN